MTYKTFGLIIRSDFELEVLEPCAAGEGEIDLHVVRTRGIIRDPAPAFDPYFDIQPGVQYMHWRAIGAYLLERDDTVLVETHAGISDHQVAQALLGLVMSIVLERRNLLCLHASAVNVNGRAALFMGDKGAGKSTTSGSMLARGHLPITDDLVAVENTTTPDLIPAIRPGFSCMKLWPDSIEALALEARDSDRLIHPKITKVQKQMPVAIPDENVPIGAAFVLRRDPEVTQTHAVRLPAHEALQMVLRYTFMARYGESKLGRDHLIAHMKRCAGVVAKTPVFDLHIRADLTDLDALSAEIARIVGKDGD
jgi:hypothetical protein